MAYKNINLLLLVLVGFFATWGEGMQNVISSPTLFFPAFGALLIAVNLNKIGSMWRKIPKSFRVLIMFVLIHTLITSIFNPGILSFGKTEGAGGAGGDFQFYKSSTGDIILRYFMFAIISILLANLFVDKKNLKYFLIAYACGFAGTILLGGYSDSYDDLVRFSGGLQDPNAMAVDGIISMMSCVYLLKTEKNTWLLRFVLLLISVAIVAIVMSFSRGAYLTIVCMMIVYLFTIGKVAALKQVLFGIPVIAVILFYCYQTFVPSDIKYLLELRFGFDNVKEDGGAGRTDVWLEYIQCWDDFILWGTGLANSVQVLIDNHKPILKVTHNQYLKYVVECGIIGFVIYLKFLKETWSILKKCVIKNLPLVLPILVLLVATFFLNIDDARSFWIIVALANYVWISQNEMKYEK